MKKVIIVLVGILLVAFIMKDFLVKKSVEKAVKIAVGLNLEIGSLKIGIFNTDVKIKDLKVYNPEGYEEKVLVDIPEIFVDYELIPLLTKKIRITNMILNVKALNAVKNSKGELNLDALKALSEGDKKEEKAEEPKTKKEKCKLDLKIDELNLKIGTVHYKDFSGNAAQPDVKNFSINLDEKFKDIKDVNALVKLIVFKSLVSTSISGIVNLSSFALDAVGDVAKKSTEAIKNFSEGLKGLLN